MIVFWIIRINDEIDGKKSFYASFLSHTKKSSQELWGMRRSCSLPFQDKVRYNICAGPFGLTLNFFAYIFFFTHIQKNISANWMIWEKKTMSHRLFYVWSWMSWYFAASLFVFFKFRKSNGDLQFFFLLFYILSLHRIPICLPFSTEPSHTLLLSHNCSIRATLFHWWVWLFEYLINMYRSLFRHSYLIYIYMFNVNFNYG